jgi:hypothetical protein
MKTWKGRKKVEERRGTVNKAGKIKAKDSQSKWDGGQEGREERRTEGMDTERDPGTIGTGKGGRKKMQTIFHLYSQKDLSKPHFQYQLIFSKLNYG